MTVSHAIVILFILTCQLTPKSNSHVSHSFVASVYKAAFFQCLFSTSSIPVSCTVQQCIQISTRINILQCTYVHLRLFYLRVILQGFVDPIMQQWHSFMSAHDLKMACQNLIFLSDLHFSRINYRISQMFINVWALFELVTVVGVSKGSWLQEYKPSESD